MFIIPLLWYYYQPFEKKGRNLPRIPVSVGDLPNEILLEIFDCLRRDDEYEWNHRRRWYKLFRVCRKWRYLILGSASHLKLCLLCNPITPTAEMLQHSPPLPLIVHIQSIYLCDITQSTNNIIHALQYSDRVVSISVDTSVVDPKLFTALDKTFPALETFSLVVGLFESPDREFLFFSLRTLQPLITVPSTLKMSTFLRHPHYSPVSAQASSLSALNKSKSTVTYLLANW